ncbi:MAG: 30S ribosomal protein S12 methylthiotransferase RimO [Candidatus Omnitrophica bacterium]|nr:30S ribosomal protein S12 methylthiotransferase RimO [Candidatus Omnitrophota bacterium]
MKRWKKKGLSVLTGKANREKFLSKITTNLFLHPLFMKTVCLISLGCPKNLVDSEQILGLLAERGYGVVSQPEEAEVVILNTCAFLKEAVSESKRYLRTLLQSKRKKQKILVTGCLVQRLGHRLKKNKGIDGLVGTGDPAQVVVALKECFSGKPVFRVSLETFSQKTLYPRLVTTPFYAYLKISEGCSHRCRYCLIPSLRGPGRSYPLEQILTEAQALYGQGTKELILVAQDTALYGRDLPGKIDLAFLLRKLAGIGFPWIRLLYLHPAHLTPEVLEIMQEYRCFCRYLDLPFQHAHPEMLKKMGRPVIDGRKIVEEVRKKLPGVALRSTFLVGFPGETERHFDYLVNFLKETRLDRVGIFGFSREKGTPAYEDRGQIPGNLIRQRKRFLLALQREISRKKLREKVGQKLLVLVEGKSSQGWFGRTEFDAPEIDGLVRIREGELKPGVILPVKIVASDNYDLEGRLSPP